RKRPREIQLSWASAIEPKHNDAANNRKRARMGLRIHKVPSLSPCAATTVQAEKSSPGWVLRTSVHRVGVARSAGRAQHLSIRVSLHGQRSSSVHSARFPSQPPHHIIHRTTGYGPVRPVVWEGRRCGASHEKSCGGKLARNRLNRLCSGCRARGGVPY